MVVVQMSPLLTGIPDLRPQAIEALDSDINASGSGTAVGARRFLELAALTDLQTGELNDTTNDAVRARIRADIKTHLQQMSDANLDPLKLAQVKARFMMTDGDSIGAIESLTTAMAGNTRLAGDPQLIWMLANAYRSAGERTQAETYIKKIIDGKPNFLPARKMLVEELLADGTEQARLDISDQMGYLRRVAPDDPDVIRLEMLTLDPVADADQIKSLYPQLPEKTVQDLRTKAYVAAKQLQNLDEAARLLELAMAKAPDASDVRTVVLLAQGFDGTKHRAKAIDIVQKALAAHPGDTSLQYTMKALEGTSGAALNAYRDQLIAKDPDVVARNRTLAAESEGAQNWSGAEVHLKAAEAADPNDQQVWNDLFKLYLQTKKYDKMAPYLKKLSDANVDQAHGLLYQFEVAKGQNEVQRQLDIGSQMISTLPEFAMSYFCMGQAYQASGQLQQAIENYDTAIQKKGVGADAAMMLKDEITCYYALNQPEKAMVAIEEGQRRFPADPEFLLLRINYEMEHGEAEAAAQELMDLQKNNPTNPAIYLKLAAADMQIADDKIRVSDRAAANASATAARDVMIDAIKRFPEVPQMYGSLADIYRYAGDLPDAEKTIQSLDARPGWSAKPDAPLMLGELYNKANQPEKAETAYASALDRDKGDPNLILAYSRLLVDHKKYDQALAILTPYAPVNMKIRLERMNVLIAAGKDADAEAEIKLVLDQTSAAAGSSGANPQAANLEAVWAKLELDSGRWSTAADHVAKALAADPKSVTALAVSARLHMAKMPPEVDGALSDLNTARQLRPDDVEVLDALADIYLSRFDTDNAARILQAAVRTQPENVDLRLRLAYVYSDLSPVRLDQAMQVLQDGLILPGGTSNADLAIAIVSIYQKMGKTDQALQNCIVSLNAIPGNLKLIQTYFQLLVDVDRYNDALQSANQILQQNNNLWWAWSIRGQAESGTGDKSSAITDLNKALTIADSQKDSNAAHVIVDTIARTVSADAAISIVRQRQRSEASWDVNLIMLYHQNGQDDLAMAALEPFLAATAQLPPRQRLPRLELAGMIYGTAQPAPVADKAYAIYKQMLAINPDDVEALNNVASLCADDFTPPRVEEGLGYVRHAMDLVTARGTSDPLLEDTYGWLMILGGQTEQGMSILQKAVERASFPEGYYHLGEGDLRLNRPQDALQQVNLALKAISDAQAAKKPLDPMVRVRVQDLSNRVLTALGQR
jgi:tetratricopeptide (TPR) repeat protein